VVDHPVAQHALTMLRNKHTAPHQYRAISHYLLVLLLAESTRNLPIRPETVATFSDDVVGQVLAKPVVLLTVARHGLGLANRMIEFFPDMMVGAISFDPSKKGGRQELRLHLANAPALSDARVILFDPVVSTGSSSSAAIQLVRRAGATDVSLVSFVVSDSGLTRIQADFQNLYIWTAAIDAKCDARRGPMPGIGAFAERMHG
jgi:uracil phosphoribosyltransferase